jgi:hypothetical protein
MNRRLTIKRETLTELSSTELVAVAGGQDAKTLICLTGYYPTIERNCVTLLTDLLTGTTTTS